MLAFTSIHYSLAFEWMRRFAFKSIYRVAAWPGKPGNDREFFKIFNKKRFQFVLNVLHKVIYLYIILCISKFLPYFVISVYQEKFHFRILNKKYFKTLKTHCYFYNDREKIFDDRETGLCSDASLEVFHVNYLREVFYVENQ